MERVAVVLAWRKPPALALGHSIDREPAIMPDQFSTYDAMADRRIPVVPIDRGG